MEAPIACRASLFICFPIVISSFHSFLTFSRVMMGSRWSKKRDRNSRVESGHEVKNSAFLGSGKVIGNRVLIGLLTGGLRNN